ncbi:hypothetical protein GQ600_6202 [Phytophthora cactorum]|nr:hypothetical protein GQ600_6202 [Phytophthora cactorum]
MFQFMLVMNRLLCVNYLALPWHCLGYGWKDEKRLRDGVKLVFGSKAGNEASSRPGYVYSTQCVLTGTFQTSSLPFLREDRQATQSDRRDH